MTYGVSLLPVRPAAAASLFLHGRRRSCDSKPQPRVKSNNNSNNNNHNNNSNKSQGVAEPMAKGMLVVLFSMAATLACRGQRAPLRTRRVRVQLRSLTNNDNNNSSNDNTRDQSSQALPAWPQYAVTVLFDGACSVCLWEINMLKTRQKEVGDSSINFVDIASKAYQPERWQGIDTVRAAGIEGKGIHGILPSGEVVYGIPVFRQLYSALGWGWLFAAHDVPGFREIMEFGYYLFAVNRLRVTGRGQEDAEIRQVLAKSDRESGSS
ncbi:unnamed protein product [Polarella glacialis]|uniref:Thiol-disulfide oxidoreductase DCC n=1 Tax=Polarella glacialis TaxID=89957 RepID=A0A813G023_POLGL|nr:unnamed protein product [Polarella glacialis]